MDRMEDRAGERVGSGAAEGRVPAAPADRPAHEERLAALMAERTGTRARDWHAVYRARYGMQVAFDAVRDVLGAGEVSTQLLTCCTAVDPILAAGLEPVYEEVSAATAAIDPERWEPGTRTRAVVVQHTYGIVDGASSERLARIAHVAGAAVVEDCAHGVARMARGADGAPVADISVHSFGVEKMLDTTFGGMVWVNPASPVPGLAARAAELLAALPALPARLDRLSRAYLPELRVITHLPGPLRRALWHGLPRAGLFEPAVAEAERAGRLPHAPARPTARICDLAAEALADLPAIEAQRAAACEVLAAELAGAPGIEVPAAVLTGPMQPLLRFPALLPDTAAADAAIGAVCAAGHFTAAWYRPELGPGVTDPAAYRVPAPAERARLAVCDDLVARVATLPTDLAPEAAREVAAAVRAVVTS